MLMNNENIIIAFALSTIAGLSTGFGSFIALISKKNNTAFLSLSLGFSAGVMLFISFVDIFPKANTILAESFDASLAYKYTMLAFFVGMLFTYLIDKLIPSYKNPHKGHLAQEIDEVPDNTFLYRIGVFTAIAITIHNFPEGMVTFAGYLADPKMGITLTIAIALHNIPEGIAVAIPIYYSTGSKKKAFWFSFLSGLSEPLGAIFSYYILGQFNSEATLGFLFAGVGGVMVYISLEELIPTSRIYDKSNLSLIGLFSGMLVVAISLVFIN